jgi:hypothetical protein
MSLSGSCSCGAVTYTCAGAPVFSGNCHCLECQKASGGAHTSTFFVPRDTVAIRGEPKWYERVGDSGKPVRRAFCPNCGAQMFTQPSIIGHLIGVRAGTLDDPEQFKPQMDLYVSRARSWDFMDPALPKFPEAPPRKK